MVRHGSCGLSASERGVEHLHGRLPPKELVFGDVEAASEPGIGGDGCRTTSLSRDNVQHDPTQWVTWMLWGWTAANYSAIVEAMLVVELQ